MRAFASLKQLRDQRGNLTTTTVIIQVSGYPPAEMSPDRCVYTESKGREKREKTQINR